MANQSDHAIWIIDVGLETRGAIALFFSSSRKVMSKRGKKKQNERKRSFDKSIIYTCVLLRACVNFFARYAERDLRALRDFYNSFHIRSFRADVTPAVYASRVMARGNRRGSRGRRDSAPFLNRARRFTVARAKSSVSSLPSGGSGRRAIHAQELEQVCEYVRGNAPRECNRRIPYPLTQ